VRGHLIEDMVAPFAEGDGGDARALEQVGADLRARHSAGAAELQLDELTEAAAVGVAARLSVAEGLGDRVGLKDSFGDRGEARRPCLAKWLTNAPPENIELLGWSSSPMCWRPQSNVFNLEAAALHSVWLKAAAPCVLEGLASARCACLAR
jgi:hypothetical protein